MHADHSHKEILTTFASYPLRSHLHMSFHLQLYIQSIQISTLILYSTLVIIRFYSNNDHLRFHISLFAFN